MVELDDAEAHAITQLLDGLIRERAVQNRPTPHAMIALHRRLRNAVELSSRRQREALRLKESEASKIGSRLAADILGWGVRRVQRHAADLGAERVGDRLVFDEQAVRDYAQALQDKENAA
jgi:hypothetical protein